MGITGIIYPGEEVGILSISTYNIDVEELLIALSTIIDTLVSAKTQNVKKFFLMQLGNGGGLDIFRELLYELLFPNSFPQDFQRDIPLSNISQLLSRLYIPPLTTATELWSRKNTTISDRKPYITEKIEYNGIVRERNWTQRFRLSSADEIKMGILSSLPSELRSSEPLFSPQQMIVVTDYMCISACSFLTKLIQQNRLAKVVGLGRSLYKPYNESSDASNSASGPVHSLKQFHEVLPHFNISATIPPLFPREGMDMRIPVIRTYSMERGDNGTISDQENTTANEYKSSPPDIEYFLYMFPGAATSFQFHETVASLLLPYFDTCVSWEVQANSTQACKKGPTNGKKLKHALYGHPCNASTGKFDSSKCVFYRCEWNYYMSPAGKCVKSPLRNYEKASYYIGAILGSVIPSTVTVIIVVITIVCCCISRKGKTKEDNYMNV